MKTNYNITLTAASDSTNLIKANKDMRAALIAQYWEFRRAADEAERKMIEAVVASCEDEPKTAAEIAREVGGITSRQVAQNLIHIGEGDSRYANGSIYGTKVRRTKKESVRRFVECDMDGRPLEGAEVVTMVKRVNAYQTTRR